MPSENNIMSFSMLLNLVEASNADNKDLLWKFVKKYKNRIREKAIDAAKEKLKYQKKKPSDIPEDQLKHWVMDAEKKIKSKDKWLLLKIILLPTGASFLPWL